MAHAVGRAGLALSHRRGDGRPACGSGHHGLGCRDNLALRNHLLVRDRLRARPEAARAYGDLKQRLARQHPEDSEAYTAGKTAMILHLLAEAGLQPAELELIERANRRR